MLAQNSIVDPNGFVLAEAVLTMLIATSAAFVIFRLLRNNVKVVERQREGNKWQVPILNLLAALAFSGFVILIVASPRVGDVIGAGVRTANAQFDVDLFVKVGILVAILVWTTTMYVLKESWAWLFLSAFFITIAAFLVPEIQVFFAWWVSTVVQNTWNFVINIGNAMANTLWS